MIEFKSVSLKKGGKEILKNVSLRAPDSSVTVIIGKNGSGKTTLLRSLYSARDITGEVLVDGAPAKEMSGRELSRAVSFMPQTLPNPDVCVRELVRLGRTPFAGAFGALSEADAEAADRAIELTGLSSLADARIPTLSGGERQRAFFAMLLAKDSKTVLLDEPSSSLDAPSRAMLAEFVRALRADGRCVVLVMHDLSDAVALADTVYVMEGGKASLPMTPDEFCESDIPRRVFASSVYKVWTENGERYVFRPADL